MPVADESYDASRGRAENVDTMQSTSPIRPSTHQAAKLSSCHQIQTAAEEQTFKENLQQTELTQAPSDRIVSHKLTSIQSLADSQTDAAISSMIRETELSTQSSVIAATLSESCSVPKALAYGIDSEVCGLHLLSQYSSLANSLSTNASKVPSSVQDTDDCTSVVQNDKPRKRKRSAECQSQDCSVNAENKTKRAKDDPSKTCYISNCESISSHSLSKAHVKVHINPAHENSKNGNVNSEVSQNSAILELQMPQKRKRTSCQCPNCSVEGGNNTRDSNGRLLHLCHHPKCRKVFYNTAHLTEHLRHHSGEKPYVCTWTACGKSFASKSKRTRHMNTHKKLSTCPCSTCNVEGENKVKDSNGRLQHACYMPDCGRVFRHSRDLKRNLNVHNGTKHFFCAHCDTGFARKDTLKRHVQVHMPADKKRILYQILNRSAEDDHKTSELKDKPLHVCPMPDCGKVFAKLWNLKAHVRVHSGKIDFICSYCCKNFSRKDHLKRHLRTHAQTMQKVPKDDSDQVSKTLSINKVEKSQERKRINCQCPNCTVGGGNNQRHSNGKPLHKCHIPECGRIFSRTSHLKDHLRRHSGEKPYVCTWSTCEKSFVKNSDLTKHIKRHKKPSEYLHVNSSVESGNKTKDSNERLQLFCAHCNMKFARKHQLRCHVQVHMSEHKKQLKTQSLDCNTEDRDTKHAQKYMPRHKKQSKCQCPNCSAKGGNKTRDPSGNLLHVCHHPDCRRVFVKPWNLKTHLNVHSGKKDFVCSHCSKQFTRKYSLEIHLRTHANATQTCNTKNESIEISHSLSINQVEKSQKGKRTNCKCPYCRAEGGNKNRNSTGRLLHKCHIPKCGKVFSRTSHLKVHLRSCHDEKPVFRFLPLTLLGLRVAKAS